MKTAVIYSSQTGFTRRYARWIAEAAGADCLALPEAKKADLSGYDAVVFGGWACAGGIRDLKWFKARMGSWSGKKLIVFCVGASPMESPEVGPALRRNFTPAEWERVRAFYCPGGLSYERMPAPSRLLMKLFARSLQAKRDKTEAEALMARMVAASYDISDRKYIEPILACLAE